MDSNILRTAAILGVLLASGTAFSAAKTLNSSYTLPPGKQIKISGSMFGSKEKDCTVSAEGHQTRFNFYSRNKTTIINGYLVNEGMMIDFDAPINSHFYFKMDRSAQLVVTNLSYWTANFSCK